MWNAALGIEVAVPSKYKRKLAAPVTKQGGWQPNPIMPRCTNCGREGFEVVTTYSKCYCGGTLQTYGVKRN